MSTTTTTIGGSIGETASSYYEDFEFPSVLTPQLFPYYEASLGGFQPSPSAADSSGSFPEASLVMSNAGFLQALRQHDEILARRKGWGILGLSQSPDISLVRTDSATRVSPISSPGSSYKDGNCQVRASAEEGPEGIPSSISIWEQRTQRLANLSTTCSSSQERGGGPSSLRQLLEPSGSDENPALTTPETSIYAANEESTCVLEPTSTPHSTVRHERTWALTSQEFDTLVLPPLAAELGRQSEVVFPEPQSAIQRL